MPIIYRSEPAEAGEALKAVLERMAFKRAFTTPKLRSYMTKKTEAPLPEQALPIYHLGLSDIAKNQDLQISTHTGWRHALKQNNEIIAQAETIISPDGKHLFSAINEGPLVEGTNKAIKVAEEQSEIKKGNFEVRLLFIPALYVTALWLVNKEEKNDFVMPIEPAPDPFTPNKLIPLQDFLSILHEKAKSALEFYRFEETLGS